MNSHNSRRPGGGACLRKFLADIMLMMQAGVRLALMTATALTASCLVASGQVTYQVYGLTSVGTAYEGLYRLDSLTGSIQESIRISDYGWPYPGLLQLASDGDRLWSIWGSQGPVTARIIRIRQADGAIEEDWETGFKWNHYSLAVHPVTGRVYSIGRPIGVSGVLTLYEIDPIGRTVTVVAPLTGPHTGAAALVISTSGQAFIFGGLGPDAYRLDLATGVTTSFGALSFPGFTGSFMDAAFDQAGILWVSYVDTWTNLHTGVYKVDLNSLTHTKIIGLTSPYYGLAIGPVPALTSYCFSKPSSQGCFPTISGSGYPCAVARRGFTLRGTDIPNQKAGLLMYGINGPQALPFQGGVLCVNSPIKRSRGLSSGGSALPANDCSGSWSIDFNTELFATHQNESSTPLPPTVPPGTIICAQWWGRDPGYPASFNTVLSDALQFPMAP